jgi:hypothetical protein
MTSPQVEYVGFAVKETAREYMLRVRHPTGASDDFTLAISNQAFLDRRVRYQDGPDLCFLKLQRELAATVGTLPASYLSVSDAEIEAYRTSHAPKPPQRRPKAPVQE